MSFTIPFNGLKLEPARYGDALCPLVTFSSLVEIAAAYRHEPTLDVEQALKELKAAGVDTYDVETYDSANMATPDFSDLLAVLFYQDPSLLDNTDATYDVFEDIMTFCTPKEYEVE